MAFVYTLLIVSVISLVCLRIIKKKSTPSISYTPYDEIMLGNKIDVKPDSPMADTKHHIEYVEIDYKTD